MFPTGELDDLLDKLANGKLEARLDAWPRLIAIGGAAVLPLIDLLNDPEKKGVWWLAANALGEIGDKRATEPLIQLLKHPLSFEALWARKNAAGALGQLKDQRAVDVLLEVLRNRIYETGEDGSVFERPDEDTIETVEWALAEIGDLRALEPIVQRIFEDYYQEGTVLQKWGEPALKLLLNELNNNPDENRRDHAASLLGGFGDLRAVEPLIEILQNDASPRVRHSAAYALGLLGDPRAFDAFITALDDPYEQTRAVAAMGLGKLNDRRAIDALKQASQDENPHVRRAANQALERIESQQTGRIGRTDDIFDGSSLE
jgi:HEAT repeat protein